MPVHYGGRPVDIDALRSVADGIPIIEDCAHACGSSLRGRRAGSLGDMGCFSFHAVKNLTMGDGGALTLDDPELAARAKRLRWLGIDKGTWDRTEGDRSYSWEYSVDEIGPKCYMNDIAAAIGLVQLAKLDAMNARRAEIADLYTSRPGRRARGGDAAPRRARIELLVAHLLHQVRAPRRPERVAPGARDLDRRPLQADPYLSMLRQPAGARTAERVFPLILSLPMYPGLTDDDVDKVVSGITSFYAPVDQETGASGGPQRTRRRHARPRTAEAPAAGNRLDPFLRPSRCRVGLPGTHSIDSYAPPVPADLARRAGTHRPLRL